MHISYSGGLMKPQTSPSSKPAISIDRLYDLISDLSEETLITAIILPVGIQVELFFEEFYLTKVLYSIGTESIDITDIIYGTSNIPQTVIDDEIKTLIPSGDFDVCGTLYLSPDSFNKINRHKARYGEPTFRYMESAIMYILNAHEHMDELKFTPHWSYALAELPQITEYNDILDILAFDFTIMDHISTNEHITVNVKTIGNIEAYYRNLLDLDSASKKEDFSPKSILLFGDEIKKAPMIYTSIDKQIIGEIDLQAAQDKIKIAAVEIEPDRYGRMRPVISSDDVNRHECEFYTIALPSIEYLKAMDYNVGDVVELNFIKGIPQIGRILEKAEHIKLNIDHERQYCQHCGSRLQQKQKQFYCSDVHCETRIINRMIYASSRQSLDLPFDWRTIAQLVLNGNVIKDLPSFLGLTRDDLMTYYDTELIDFILNKITKRLNMLHGCRSVPNEVQNLTQGRFLDALSLNGLHKRNIKYLREGLWRKQFIWSDLAQALTDHSLLSQLDIHPQDVIEIIKDAKSRLYELDSIAREF